MSWRRGSGDRFGFYNVTTRKVGTQVQTLEKEQEEEETRAFLEKGQHEQDMNMSPEMPPLPTRI